MEKFVIIIPPHTGRELAEFPLGVGYLANQVIKAGFELEIIDINALLLSHDQVTDLLKKSKCRLFGVSAFSTQYKYYKWLTQIIKEIDKDNLIITGGPLPTHQYPMVLENTNTDICVIGEADYTIIDLLNSIDNYYKVKGIAYKKDNQIICNEPQSPFDLDKLDFHPYHLFPVKAYFEKQPKQLSISVSRGCPYKCNFCSVTMPDIRLRSINHIEAELRELKKKYKIESIQISDELAILNDKRGYELSDMFVRLGLWWIAQIRVNIANYDLLKYMRNHGCRGLSAGVESGSQKMLDNMNKKTTVKQNYDFINNCRKLGIYTWIPFLFGYPGEDDKTIKESINFLNKLKYVTPNPQAVGMFPVSSLLTPMPGSKLYKDCIKFEKITDEVEYTLKLEKGYYISDEKKIPCNLTEYSNSELVRKKNEFERTAWNNYQNWENRPGTRLRKIVSGIFNDVKKFASGLNIRTVLHDLKLLFYSIVKRISAFNHLLEDRNNIPNKEF